MDYSVMNIPIPTHEQYTKTMVEKIEDLDKRMRWEAWFFLNPKKNDRINKETYGFRTSKEPPVIPQLKNFKDDMYKLVARIKFRNVNSTMQNKLRNDVQEINKQTCLLVPADKTNNYYKVSKEEYGKLMQDNVTRLYERADDNVDQILNSKSKKITEKLNLSDRIDVLAPKNARITLKDHKRNFRESKPCRLINPTKTDIQRISKVILERINEAVVKETGLNQWKSTGNVIQWFENLAVRRNTTFIVFDIINYYPSISKDLLQQAIQFARKYTKITKEEEEIIFQAKETILIHNQLPWKKKESDGLFDVTMGSWDGAESCEIVGTYILYSLREALPHMDVGLYRDDGLGVIHNTPREAEKTKKKLCEVFRGLGLSITVETNRKVVDYLDITLDLGKKEFKPYSKPGSNHQYVHTQSNHPPTVIKQIPISIQNRLSTISSNQTVFDQHKREYEKALKEAGHATTLVFTPKPNNDNNNNNAQRKRKRKNRKITWFCPPYSKNVQTNVGEEFLKIVDKNFSDTACRLRPIFNRNRLKLSYSCMENMGTIIKKHNNKILRAPTTSEPAGCKCRDKTKCPLPKRCETKALIYKATITSAGEQKNYIGLTSNTFKERYTQHKSDFNLEHKRFKTALSKYVWELKKANKKYNISWEVMKRASPYTPSSKKCNLCGWEKVLILSADRDKNNLNQRSEISNPCLHRKKWLLSQYEKG